MEKTRFVFAPDMAASVAWYTALLGYGPVPDARRIRYRLPHGVVVLTALGRPGQHHLQVDASTEVRPHLAGRLSRPARASPTGFVSCHDPAGNRVLVVALSHRF